MKTVTVKKVKMRFKEMYAVVVSEWFGLKNDIYCTYFTRAMAESQARELAREFNFRLTAV